MQLVAVASALAGRPSLPRVASRAAPRHACISASASPPSAAQLALPDPAAWARALREVGPPRVIFTDCDGTLLGPDHRLSARSTEALRRLSELGVRVVPATGRARAGAWTQHVLTERALNGGVPGIYLNGGAVFDEGAAPQSSTVPADVVADVLDFAEARRSRATAVAYVGDEALVDRPKCALAHKLAAVGDSPLRGVARLAARGAVQGAVHKVLFLTSDEEAAGGSLRAELELLVGTRADVTQALRWCVEVCPRGVHKGRAAGELLERWGVAPEEALAIGDGENDVQLLQLCGHSVAMDNGVAAAKRSAQLVAPSNAADGWAAAIDALVLAPLGRPLRG